MSKFFARAKKLIGLIALGISLSLVVLFFYAYFLSDLRVIPSQYKIDWSQHPVIIFESDDWGATRSFANMKVLEKGGHLLPVEWRERFKSLVTNTLESPGDLEKLFSILSRHTGADGLPVVFTANYVMCSPDYMKIRESHYTDFHSLEIPRVPTSWIRGDFVEKAIEGMSLGVWSPEYHGVLHADPYRWMELLSNSDVPTLRLFNLESYAGMNHFNGPEYSPSQNVTQQRTLIEKGTKAFRAVFGYSPRSSISPFCIWQSTTEKLLAQQGVKVIQGKNGQSGNDRSLWEKIIGKVLNVIGYKSADKPWQIQMGDRNVNLDIVYLLRNIHFETLIVSEGDTVKKTIADILSVLSQGQPAIISTHRYNYVSTDASISESNLLQLDRLLEEIEKGNPNVIYLTDWELTQHYLNGYSLRKIGNRIVIRNFSNVSRDVSIEVPAGFYATDDAIFPKHDLIEIVSPNTNGNRIPIPAHTTRIIRFASQRPQSDADRVEATE